MAIDRYDCVARPLYRRLSPSNVKRVILLFLDHGITFIFCPWSNATP